VPFAFIDPVIQPIIVSVVAVPLHALAYLTASQEAAETVDSSVH
jgi:type IV secretory pathway VirB3-like protein